MNGVTQVPAGWWRAPNVPTAQFRTRRTAEKASRASVAKAWTMYYQQGTLAKGEAFKEGVVRFKQASGLPLTPGEREWLDKRVKALRAGGKRRHEPSLVAQAAELRRAMRK